MLSIVTLTYNNFEELKRTLDSVSGLGAEHVVVNGGQCEDTGQWLRENKIRHRSEPDKGIADAFNKGLSLAQGDYIWFLNSGDVLLDKSYIEKSLKILKNNSEIDFVHSGIILNAKKAGYLKMYPRFNLPNMPFFHPTMIVKRSVFNKIGFFDEQFKVCMDLDWVYRLMRHQSQGTFLNIFAVEMDYTGVSAESDLLQLREKLLIIKKYSDFKFRTFVAVLVLILKLVVKSTLKSLGLTFVKDHYRRIKNS